MDSEKRDIPTSSGKTPVNGMFISTKLHMPPVKPELLLRGHLVGHLTEGQDRRLIVISGVAGSGKTSLVCQWIAQNGLLAAWYSLDRTDNESDLFFRYLFKTLIAAEKRLAATLGPLLDQQRPLSGKEITPLLIESLMGIAQDIYVVLDDYHLIQSGEIHDTLSYLLDYMPPRVHIVFLSRYALPISLGHFRVRNQITEIAASDMQFSEEETAGYFSKIMSVDLSSDEVRELVRYTEGWVGGLQLLGLSLKNNRTFRDLGDILKRACREMADYLVDEVVRIQPPKVETFLRATVLLGRFNADLCREVTGLPDAAEIIDYLYRNNLFLTPLDGERIWYRYHHIFSEAIRKQAMATSAPMFRDVQRRAALWFAANGYLEDAFRHAFSSEDFEFTADLLEEYLLGLPDESGYAGGARWLTKIPYHILNGRALLKLHECGHKTESFRLEEIEEILKGIETDLPHAFERYHGARKVLCQDLYVYFSSVVRCYYRNPGEPDIEGLNKAYGMISHENRLFAGYLKIIIALGYIRQADPLKAADALREASAIVSSTNSIWGQILCAKYSASVEGIQGHLCRSQTILREAFEMLEERGLADSPHWFLLQGPMGWNCYYRNELDTAEECAAKALRYGEQVGFVRDVVETRLLKALILFARGDATGAEGLMRKMRLVVETVDASDVGSALDAWAIRLSLRRGDSRAALKWADRRHLTLEEPFSFRFAFECMTWAEMLYRQGRYDETADMLEGFGQLCSKRNLMLAVLDANLLYSATLYALGNRDGSKAVMERALTSAEPEGCVRPFINYGSIISPVLLEMVRDGWKNQDDLFLRMVLKACGIADEYVEMLRKPPGPKEMDDLTAREIEILRLMSTGYTNREIADKIFVSLHTIKSHIKHIYAKMNVVTRTQAVRRLQELSAAERAFFR